MDHDTRFAASDASFAASDASFAATDPAASGGLGLPIASLVLGLLGCLVPLVGLVAIALGVVSLVRRTAGRVLAICGIAFGSFSLLVNIATMAALLLPALGAARLNAATVSSASQMQEIHRSLQAKAITDPSVLTNPNLEASLSLDSPGLRLAPLTETATGGTSYLWIMPVEGEPTAATDLVLAENPQTIDRRRLNVLLGSGVVEVRPREEVMLLLLPIAPRVFNTDGTPWTPAP